MLFRFSFLYFGLYYLPFPLSVFGGLAALPPPLSWVGAAAGWLQAAYGQGLSAVARGTGSLLLGLPEDAMPIQPTGSGDTMIGYVRAVTVLVVAVVGTAAWSIASGRRAYPRLEHLFRIYLRYALAAILLSYGFAKVPPMQFPKPGPELLVQTYGESSPMGLLWRFMGFSPVYTMFAGIAEIVPGLLLLFRRTTTLGALIATATMANVVMLNFCYDVPVKLYSVHLLLTAMLLLAPDLPRLARVLLLDRPTQPAVPPQASPAPFRRPLGWAKAMFLVLLVGGQVLEARTSWKRYGPDAPKPALYGVWEVDSFTLDGEPRETTDAARWRRFMVSRWGGAIVQQMGEQVNRFTLKHDDKAGTVTLTSRGEASTFTLEATRPEEGRLVLEGPFRDGLVRVELRRARDLVFPIDARGFHWVQEFPYNR